MADNKKNFVIRALRNELDRMMWIVDSGTYGSGWTICRSCYNPKPGHRNDCGLKSLIEQADAALREE